MSSKIFETCLYPVILKKVSSQIESKLILMCVNPASLNIERSRIKLPLVVKEIVSYHKLLASSMAHSNLGYSVGSPHVKRTFSNPRFLKTLSILITCSKGIRNLLLSHPGNPFGTQY